MTKKKLQTKRFFCHNEKLKLANFNEEGRGGGRGWLHTMT